MILPLHRRTVANCYYQIQCSQLIRNIVFDNLFSPIKTRYTFVKIFFWINKFYIKNAKQKVFSFTQSCLKRHQTLQGLTVRWISFGSFGMYLRFSKCFKVFDIALKRFPSFKCHIMIPDGYHSEKGSDSAKGKTEDIFSLIIMVVILCKVIS